MNPTLKHPFGIGISGTMSAEKPGSNLMNSRDGDEFQTPLETECQTPLPIKEKGERRTAPTAQPHQQESRTLNLHV